MTRTPNRTTTAKWKNLRLRALRQAQAQGITHCPHCKTWLDYTTGKRPNGAVPDHIKAAVHGGEDTLENLQIICYRCNARDGGRIGNQRRFHKAPQQVQTIDFTT